MLRSIIAFSSICSIIGGLLLGLYQTLHPHRDAHSVLEHPYALIHNLGMLALTLICLGIIGIYLFLYAEAQSNRLVTVLFFLTLLGSIFEVGALFLDGYFNPFAATYMPELQTSGHNHNFFHQYFSIYGLSIFLLPVTWLLFIAGQIGTGILLIASKRFGLLSGVLIIAGAPLFGLQLFAPLWMETTGAIVLGLGYLMTGVTLFNRNAQQEKKLNAVHM
ncbi:hypothetical protein [Paenibacillus sp. SI8]|uniref:hypothetical protein n=1 Tax=unclassified Paenibacillus TaxID=185978 RepID=UPI0034673B80